MKLALILFFAGVLQVSASVYSQQTRISFIMKDKSVKEVLDQIQESTDFRFFYNENFTDLNRQVSIEARNNLINDILDELLVASDVTYRVLENNLIVLTPKSMLKQQRITGKVTDASTGEPMAGVNVRIEGTNTGTITDVEGNYTVDMPLENTILQFSFIGYNIENVTIAGRSQINVAMVPELTTLDEVIVVGYGVQSKRNVTGSVQSVSSDEISDMPTTTVAQKLQGKLSGVQINQTTGKPGEGMQIRIRGQASLTGTVAGNQPLYVVDGFPVIGDITSINPNEIESISILKDASSTALYGSRAANGVVMVTTKRAKTGKTAVNFNAYYGWQTVPEKGRPEMMNGTEFAQFKKESYEDLQAINPAVTVPALFQDPESYGEGYNIYDALLSTAPMQDYSISFSTSREKFSTTAVVGYFSQDGVVLNSDYKRYSIRLNSDFNVTDKVKAGFSIAPTSTVANSPNTDGIFWSSGLINNSLLSWPIYPYINEDGSMPMGYFDPTVQTFPLPNYYRSALEITNETKAVRLLSNAYLQYEIIPGLILKSTLNFDYFDEKYTNFNPSTVSGGFAVTLPTDASGRFRTRRYNTWLNENTLTYKKSFGEHNIDAIVGQTMQKYTLSQEQIAVTRIPDDRVPTIASAQQIDRANTNNLINEWSLLSYLGRINYNFKNKYLLSASIRADGSSRFGEDDRWGTFPSVSAGWIVSEEGFMKGLSAISLLKLRASWGIVGNNNIENYNQYARVSSGTAYSSVFGSTAATGAGAIASGTGVSSMPNSQLTWEQTAEYDLGFDIGFFNNRINIGYDYYNRKTKSLLYNVVVAQESGFQNYWGNIGELQFWGHEFQLNTRNLVGDLKWSTDFNISFTDNKVNELTGVVDRVYGDWTITKVGQKIGLFYGLDWDGVYDNQEEFDNSPNNPQLSVGSIKYKDHGGSDGVPDGRITNGGDFDDRIVIGDPTPTFIYGMTNNLSYKNIDLSFVLSGSYGNDILKRLEQGTTNLDGVFNVLKGVNDRWRSPDNPGSGKYGKTTSGTAPERDWASSRFVANASFLSIKNITLGYTIPLGKMKFISSFRVFASAQQVYTFTNYDGTNPEVSMTNVGQAATALNLGQDYGGYPIPRTISFGLNLGL